MELLDRLLFFERTVLCGPFFRPKHWDAALDSLFFGSLLALSLVFFAAYAFRRKDRLLLIFSILCFAASFLYLAPGTFEATLSSSSFRFVFTLDFEALLFAATYVLVALCIGEMSPGVLPRQHFIVLGYVMSFFVLASIVSRGAVHDMTLLALRIYLLGLSAYLFRVLATVPGAKNLRVSMGFGLLLFPLAVASRLVSYAFDLGMVDVAYFGLLIFVGSVAFLLLREILVVCGDLEKEVASYARFVPQEFLNLLQRTISDVKLGDSTEVAMSILFADIRDFTTLSEQMTPDENFKFVNAYCEIMGEVIKKNGGFIDKFIGDAIMALFTGTADAAVKCSVEMLQRLEDYNEGRIRAGYTPIRIGIGVNAGILRLGAVGDAGRIQGTVIGDAVNIASRLESMTKMYGVSILISDSAYSLLVDPSKYHLRKIGKVRAKGKKDVVQAWEVFNRDNNEMQKHKIMVAEVFNEAVKLFDERCYDDALMLFQNCIANNENDATAQYYLDKSRLFVEMNKSGTQEGFAKVVRYERFID